MKKRTDEGYAVLRQLVRGVLVEAAATSQVASGAGLALMRRESGGQMAYVLYAPTSVEQMLDSGDIEADAISKAIYGYISIKPHEGEAWNAGEVKLSAAQKGYGPLMYQYAMNDYAGGLFPDRGSTSQAARGVWQKYAANPQVEKKPFDDPSNPKTPDKIDDMIPARGTSYDGDEAYLNQAYDAPGDAGGRSGLMQAHQTFLQNMTAKKFNKQTVETMIDSMGDEYFSARYRNG